MNTDLSYKSPASTRTELLTVFAVDGSGAKDKKSQPELLISDRALQSAAAEVLGSGEFKACAMESVLLHAPRGISAKRLLILGLGKASKATVHDARKAAAVATRQAKTKSIREIAIVLPDSLLPPGPCVQAVVEGVFLGDFDSDTYRSDREDKSLTGVAVI